MRLTPAIEQTIRSYGAPDHRVGRIWCCIERAVYLGTPIHQALDELKRNRPELFKL